MQASAQGQLMLFLSQDWPHVQSMPTQEENCCCHRTGRCKLRNNRGKRLGLVAAQGTTAKPNLNPLPNVQPSSVDGAAGGGIQPKISKTMLRNEALEVNIVENGFSHNLLYYEGQINN